MKKIRKWNPQKKTVKVRCGICHKNDWLIRMQIFVFLAPADHFVLTFWLLPHTQKQNIFVYSDHHFNTQPLYTF